MRILATRFLSITLGVGLALAPKGSRAAPPEAAVDEVAAADRPGAPQAAKAYEEGEAAYRLGKFGLAIDKFEAAYQLSKRPSLLYNVGLAYKRNYELSEDLSDLRRAKAVLDNYLNEVTKDPSVGDPGEANTLIAEVEALLKGAEGPEGSGAAQADVSPAGTGEDPGRRLKRWGVTGLVLGGGGMLLGVASGIGFGVAAAKGGPDHERYDLFRGLSLGLGIGLSVVGGAVFATGAGLLKHGKKKTRAWRGGKVEVNVVPMGPGLGLAGRF